MRCVSVCSQPCELYVLGFCACIKNAWLMYGWQQTKSSMITNVMIQLNWSVLGVNSAVWIYPIAFLFLSITTVTLPPIILYKWLMPFTLLTSHPQHRSVLPSLRPKRLSTSGIMPEVSTSTQLVSRCAALRTPHRIINDLNRQCTLCKHVAKKSSSMLHEDNQNEFEMKQAQLCHTCPGAEWF